MGLASVASNEDGEDALTFTLISLWIIKTNDHVAIQQRTNMNRFTMEISKIFGGALKQLRIHIICWFTLHTW
jgi:hypothetical protein